MMKVIDEMSFEEAMSELNLIVEKLESELTLGDSLDLFDRGQRLLDHCNRLIDAAKLRLTRESLDEREDGK